MPNRRTEETEARERRDLVRRIDVMLGHVVNLYQAMTPKTSQTVPAFSQSQEASLRREIVDRLGESR